MKQNLMYPKVLLIGRTNVGKSTLFNRLSQQRKSIVFEREGVTRDYIQELVNWRETAFLLIDTGGLSYTNTKNQSDISKQVQEKVLALLKDAALILFVCDGKNGLTTEDLAIAQLLRKSKKKIILLLNKSDNTKALENNISDFYTLGIEPMLLVSAVHSIGIGSLLDTIASSIPKPITTSMEKPNYKVAIIGKPNVGKSSLMNLLIAHERSIVSPVSGTTREAITETTYILNDLVQIIDTPGVRRSRAIDDDLEQLMVRSSLQTIKEADLILIMIDASEGKIADQELKLLFYAYEHRKMVITVINKTDLLTDYSRFLLEKNIDANHFIFKKIQILWISCLTQKNVNKIYGEIQKIWQQCNQIFNEIEVDELIRRELDSIALYHNKEQLKVLKVRTIKDQIPTFALYVNYPEWFGPSEIACVENILRKHYKLVSCPVKITAHQAEK